VPDPLFRVSLISPDLVPKKRPGQTPVDTKPTAIDCESIPNRAEWIRMFSGTSADVQQNAFRLLHAALIRAFTRTARDKCLFGMPWIGRAGACSLAS
jgi:hypothetical protein